MGTLAHPKRHGRARALSTTTVLGLLVAAPGLSPLAGCARRDRPQAGVEAAYQAGRRQALDEVYESRFPVVTILGPVEIPKLDWTGGLTLARAIVAARYQAPADPSRIILHRGGTAYEISPARLLAGEDWLLLPGDRIEIIP